MSPPSLERTERTVLTWAGVVLAGFAVVGGVLLATSLLHHHDTTPTVASTTSASPSELPSKALDDASASASETPSTAPLPTADQMKDFVVQYLDTATTNQAAAWQTLTPRFRSSSGGFAAYQGFWGGIASADPSEFSASPVDGTIGYRVRYTHTDGRVTDDSTRIHLLYDGSTFQIDAEG